MKSGFLPKLVIIMLLVLCLSVSGIYAVWKYYAPSDPVNEKVPMALLSFKYGTLYITDVAVNSGSYSAATAKKTGELNISADLTLNSNTSSSVTVAVTFYNSTDVNYYYNKTEAVSSNNDNIGFTVTGIEQKDAVTPKSYKTVYVLFSYNGGVSNNKSLLSELHFNFVVDKDSIGGIVAQTAVDRFRDILNNKAFENSYQTLEDGMNNRSGFNKASAVTYIGNVSGSTSADSQLVESLFGEEFMSMDLDGDGNAEPITMMIKRENLDNDITTGGTYTYTSWGREYTVEGVEMTLYITSENLDNISSGKSVVVYAASFTKLSDGDEWTDLVPLTKGTANANNYSGYGSANSFNTDTWVSDDGKKIGELAIANK